MAVLAGAQNLALGVVNGLMEHWAMHLLRKPRTREEGFSQLVLLFSAMAEASQAADAAAGNAAAGGGVGVTSALLLDYNFKCGAPQHAVAVLLGLWACARVGLVGVCESWACGRVRELGLVVGVCCRWLRTLRLRRTNPMHTLTT